MAKPIYRSNTAAGLLRDGENIFAKMTENAELFPNPDPDLPAFESSLDAYRDAYAAATFRDKRAVVLKSQKGQELQKAIYQLSRYVDAVADGDEAVILAAGYRPTRSPINRIGRTPRAENLRVENPEVGTGLIRLRIKPWRHARLYQFEYRGKGTAEWATVIHNKSVLEVSDLEMLQEYEFRASYLGTDTSPNYSDVITARVV
ncbi:hypothetical protein [Parapedobacter tibetensis]|uniref:hypothetical protein n=1 Tax=Parapedobacter tibetensis TaxID=2972951 RepID=UPI00214D4537|nr:hypothetical protein [Parapedobacter tibetensis]